MKINGFLAALLALLVVAVSPHDSIAQAGCKLLQPGSNESTNCGGTYNFKGVTISGTFAPADVSATDDITVADDLTVSGDTTLGNGQADVTAITGLLNLDKYAQVGIPCRNETGASFGAGDVVTFDNSTGWTEANTARLVKLADNDANLFGHAVITGTLATATTGTCYLHWRSSATLNTDGLAVGAPIYLSATATTTNTWTSSAPTGATAIGQKVGYVAVASATVGVIVFDFMPPRVYRFGRNELQADAVGLAEMAAGTAGNLITYDASGNPAAVATGTAGHTLISGGAGVAPTFTTLASTGITDATIAQADVSRVFGTGTAPSVSACGTSPPAAVGSDMAFSFTLGTGDPTACTLTFASTFTNTPSCFVQTSDIAFPSSITAASATAITVTVSATGDSSSKVFYVGCIGRDAD